MLIIVRSPDSFDESSLIIEDPDFTLLGSSSSQQQQQQQQLEL